MRQLGFLQDGSVKLLSNYNEMRAVAHRDQRQSIGSIRILVVPQETGDTSGYELYDDQFLRFSQPQHLRHFTNDN